MNKKLFAFLIAFLAILSLSQPASAQEKIAAGSAVLENLSFQADERIAKLKNFLASYNSPLAKYANNFVEAADKYGIDWKLVPAITGVESTFGKNIPANSYNAYGWANGTFYFQSWEQSIDHVSKTLKEKYVDRGLDTPYKMGPVYAPPSKAWAGKVVFFMNRLDFFGELESLSGLSLTI